MNCKKDRGDRSFFVFRYTQARLGGWVQRLLSSLYIICGAPGKDPDGAKFLLRRCAV